MAKMVWVKFLKPYLGTDYEVGAPVRAEKAGDVQQISEQKKAQLDADFPGLVTSTSAPKGSEPKPADPKDLKEPADPNPQGGQTLNTQTSGAK